MDEIKNKCSQLEKENKDLIASKKFFSEKVNELQLKILQLTGQNDQLNKNIKTLYSENNEFHNQINQYKDDKILELENNINKIKNEQRKKEDKHNELYRSMEEKDKKIKYLEEYKLKYERLEKQNVKLINDKVKDKELLNSLESENQRIIKENKILYKSINDIKNDKNKQEMLYNNNISEFQKNSQKLNSEINKLKEVKNQNENRINQLENDKKDLINQIEDLKELEGNKAKRY